MFFKNTSINESFSYLIHRQTDKSFFETSDFHTETEGWIGGQNLGFRIILWAEYWTGMRKPRVVVVDLVNIIKVKE